MTASKPRIFIGSSSEGRDIAFAIQQNLTHDVEATVWTQGVFDLSASTIESLAKRLNEVDFGIFVFSSDDEVKMRGTVQPSARDNVLFEMGLFLGRLGRERVFFFFPEGKDMHIPSDLLGVTPAKYEPNRSDANWQAATGPACNQIRSQIQRLPRLTADPSPSAPEPAAPQGKSWIELAFSGKYEEAKETLQKEVAEATCEDRPWKEAGIAYCDVKLGERAGLTRLEELSKSRPDDVTTQEAVSTMLRLAGYYDKAIELLNELPETTRLKSELQLALSMCYDDAGDADEARSMFSSAQLAADPKLAIHVAALLEKGERGAEALDLLRAAYKENPSHSDLAYVFAQTAQRHGEPEIALYLLDGLVIEEQDSAEHRGYLGNACLDLEMLDQALRQYRKAVELYAQRGGEGWVLGNIGNLFNRIGLPTEGMSYFDRVLQEDPRDEYSLSRLAQAVEAQSAQEKIYKEKLKAGKLKLRKRNPA